jgi:hypothetical protein
VQNTKGVLVLFCSLHGNFAPLRDNKLPCEVRYNIKMESDIEPREDDILLLTDTCEIGGHIKAFCLGVVRSTLCSFLRECCMLRYCSDQISC